MKMIPTQTRHIKTTLARLALVSSFFILPSALVAQGNLTPPGAPGPTMKTLDQVEPRTPISSVPFSINSPGSYYLTANLAVSSGNAISISASGVTLDLGGFTLSSTAASATGYGILIGSSLRDITILNGHIRGGVTNNGSGTYSGSGFAYGILKSGTDPVNVLVSCVSVSGCRLGGIYLGVNDYNVAERCSVRTIGGYGIVASMIRQSSATDCATDAIYGKVVSDCVGESGIGSGVSAVTAQNCYGTSGGTVGKGVDANTALNCTGISSGSVGTAINASSALNCRGASSSNGTAVHAVLAENCHGANSGGGYGVRVDLLAFGCYGYSASGLGLFAPIANSCFGSSDSGTAINVGYKYNMP